MNNDNILTTERKEEILEKIWDRKKKLGILVEYNGIFVFLNDGGHLCPHAQVYFQNSQNSFDWSCDVETGTHVLPSSASSGLYLLKYKKKTAVLKYALAAEECTHFYGFDEEHSDAVLLAKVEYDNVIYILYLDERRHIPFFSLSFDKCLYNHNAEALFRALRCLQSDDRVAESGVNSNESGTSMGI